MINKVLVSSGPSQSGSSGYPLELFPWFQNAHLELFHNGNTSPLAESLSFPLLVPTLYAYLPNNKAL